VHIKAIDIYGKYSANIGSPVSQYGFNRIVGETFTKAQRDTILENSKPYVIFRGIGPIYSPTLPIITTENILKIAKLYGYQNINTDITQTSLRLYRILSEHTISSQKAIAEIKIEISQTNKISFIIGNKDVFPEGLPNTFTTEGQLQSILSETSKRTICEGFTVSKEIDAHVSHLELERWNFAPPAARSKNCNGYMLLSRSGKVCPKCVQNLARLRRKNALSERNHSHMEHSYTSLGTLSPSPKQSVKPCVHDEDLLFNWSDDSDNSEDEENDPTYCSSGKKRSLKVVDTEPLKVSVNFISHIKTCVILICV